MKEPRCCICGLSVFQGAALTRVNEKGVVPAVWACYKHTDKPQCEVTRIIDEDNERRRKL